MISAFFFGLATGGLLLLVTVGFSMIKRVENFLNIAHADMLTVGAYLAYLCNVILGLPFWLSTVFSVAATAAIGLLVARLFFHPIRQHGPVILLISSVGVAYILHGSIELIAGVDFKTYPLAVSKMWTLNGIPLITPLGFAIILLAAAAVVGLHFFLQYTIYGKAIRAMSNDIALAQIRGIPTGKVAALVWLIASGLAGLGGVLLAATTALKPDLGFEQVLIILSASILGGLGSIYGVMASSLLLGIAMEISVLFLPSGYREAVAFLVIILVLLVKPEGLFGGQSS